MSDLRTLDTAIDQIAVAASKTLARVRAGVSGRTSSNIYQMEDAYDLFEDVKG